MYERALKLARSLGRPLIVVGAPDRGPTRGPGYGDITVDLGWSNAPNFVQADICKPLPFPDDYAVVYVSCVLEYIPNHCVDFARAELLRIAGDRSRFFDVKVEPWTAAIAISGNP
jgi:hypothetical protein